jgi:hypothetical protein
MFAGVHYVAAQRLGGCFALILLELHREEVEGVSERFNS